MYQIGDVMAEKNLLTLREIAEELGVNYKTLLSCKYRFNDYVLGVFVGRKVRYSKELIDFFMMLFALFDEGYSSDKIKSLLKHGVNEKEDKFVVDWIETWRSKFQLKSDYYNSCENNLGPYHQTDSFLNFQTDGLTDFRTDSFSHSLTDSTTDSLTDGLTDFQTDSFSHFQDYNQKESANNDQNVSDPKSMNIQAELDNHISQLQSDLESQLYAKLEQQIKEIVSNLENCLLNLKGQINGSMTEIYKAIHQLQDGMKYLEKKLSQLQQDLGVEQLDQIKFPELDLNNMQIDTPNIGLECSTEDVQEDNTTEDGLHADLEFVRNSIREGKPDKEAVIQWIHAQRNSDPPVSYGEMANMLNQEQIPTMKGKEGWNRGMVNRKEGQTHN